MIRHPPSSTLFPYPPLFRSCALVVGPDPERIHIAQAGRPDGEIFIPTAESAATRLCRSGLCAVRLAEVGPGLAAIDGFPGVSSCRYSLNSGCVNISDAVGPHSRFDVLCPE